MVMSNGTRSAVSFMLIMCISVGTAISLLLAWHLYLTVTAQVRSGGHRSGAAGPQACVTHARADTRPLSSFSRTLRRAAAAVPSM